jgi:hypothetical protein
MALSRSQPWKSRVANSRAMNSTIPNRIRASEMRNCPTSSPKKSEVNQSRMSLGQVLDCLLGRVDSSRQTSNGVGNVGRQRRRRLRLCR